MEGVAAHPVSIHRCVRTVFFAGAFTDFFADFLGAVFLAGDFLAAVFLAAFFVGAFLAALFSTALFATFLGASFAGFSALVTVLAKFAYGINNPEAGDVP